jgi:hypothetical protein
MTVCTGFPHADAMSSQVVRRLCATSLALMAISDAWPRACDFGWFKRMVALGRAKRCPRLPLASNMAAAPNAATVGRRGTRRVNVHGNGIRRGLVIEVEEFGNNQFGDGGDQGHANVNDAIVQEQRR